MAISEVKQEFSSFSQIGEKFDLKRRFISSVKFYISFIAVVERAF